VSRLRSRCTIQFSINSPKGKDPIELKFTEGKKHRRASRWSSLLLLLGRFSDFTLLLDFLNGFDNTDGDGLSHVSDGETSERGVLSESFNTHWLGWFKFNDSGVTRLDFAGVVFDFLTRTAIDFLLELVEAAGDVRGVAIEDWSVTLLDFTWMIEDNDLSVEGLGFLGWVLLGVGANVTTADFFDRDVLDVETDVVTGDTLVEGFVVHFYGFDFSSDGRWGEGNNHTGFDETGFDTADWHRSDTTDLVDVLEWESEGFVGWSTWWDDGVEGLEESFTGLFASFFGLFSPTFVPGHVFGGGDHVVSVPSGNWDESDGFWVVTDFLDVRGDFLDDFFESVFGVFWLGVVHLVNSNDELFDTEGESEKSVFSGLTVLGDTGFKFTDTSGDDEDGAIGLGSTGDHVFDEISVTWGIDDGDFVFFGLEFPESDIDGDTSFSFGLKFVQDPGVFKGTFAHLGGFFLELFDGSLVDTTTFVDQMTGGGRFTGIDVTDDDDIDMSLCFSHVFCKFDLRL